MEKITKKSQLRLYAEGIEDMVAEKQEPCSRTDDISHLQSEVTHICANPTLKLMAIEKGLGKKSKAPVHLDENRKTHEQVVMADSLWKKKHISIKYDHAVQKLSEQQGKLDVLVNGIKESRGKTLQSEPRDETRCTELHKRNIALANILTLLTSAAGHHASSGKRKRIYGLVNKVHTMNYGEELTPEAEN